VADGLKDYLVGLGFKLDESSFNKVQDTLKKFDDNVRQKTSSMAASYTAAGSAIVSALAGVTTATAELLDKIAQADLGYTKFAMHMYMARDAAKQFKIVTDSMGESIEDIAWIPELNERYKSLMGQAARMETPKDAQGQLRQIRDIRFEFTRLKVEATYGLQWVGYWLFKYLNEPIAGAKTNFQKFNDYLEEKIPEWSENIGKAAGWIKQLAESTWDTVKLLWANLKEIFDSLPDWAQKFTVFAGIIGALFAVGPFGRAVLVISALIVLIDDFKAHLRGEPNEFGEWIEMALMPLDSLRRLLIADQVLWDRFKSSFGGPLTQGQQSGQSVVDEIKDVWNSTSIYSQGGDLERWKAQAQGKKFSEKSYPGYSTPGLAGIGDQESKGNYNAVGQFVPGKGFAQGKYQIMPQNWPVWAMEAGLAPNALMTPENQELVAQKKWASYYTKYGSNQLAAAAWYGGPGVANRLKNGDLSALDVRPRAGISGPTVGEYIRQSQGQGFGETTNVNINLNGPTTDEHLRKVEEIVNKINFKGFVKTNRFPAMAGATP
jgi:hypothetical protein